MTHSATDLAAFVCREVALQVTGIIGRAGLHLCPARISRACYTRSLTVLRGLEAVVRRMLILLALEMEHALPRDRTIYNPRSRAKKTRIQTPQLRILDDLTNRPPPDVIHRKAARALYPNGMPPRALIDRIARLKALIEAPDKRARRLALTLARRRAGMLIAPGEPYLRARVGTELSAVYTAMGPDILVQSRNRPPHLGQRPRPPPRIRQL